MNKACIFKEKYDYVKRLIFSKYVSEMIETEKKQGIFIQTKIGLSK